MVKRITITDDEFQTFASLLVERSGMELPPARKKYLELRVSERMEATRTLSPGAYLDLITADSKAEGEFRRLVDSIVIGETFFFRTPAHFTALAEVLIPRIRSRKKNSSQKTIRAWSAGCSTGPEPYSIAITLLENLGPEPGWKIDVLATDISDMALETARTGTYTGRPIRNVPEPLKERYFTRSGDSYTALDRVKALVQFRHHNLLDRPYPKDFDVIFCRNVLIYFGRDARGEIIKGFHSSLSPDGYLFLGHSETLRDFPEFFEPVWVDGGFGYRKRPAGTAPAATVPRPRAPAEASQETTGARAREWDITLLAASPVSGEERIHTLEIEGSLDHETIEEPRSPLKRAFLSLADRREKKVLINLDRVKFMDRAGVVFLRRAAKLIEAGGARVSLIARTPPVQRWLDKEEFKGILDVARSREEAIRTLASKR